MKRTTQSACRLLTLPALLSFSLLTAQDYKIQNVTNPELLYRAPKKVTPVMEDAPHNNTNIINVRNVTAKPALLKVTRVTNRNVLKRTGFDDKNSQLAVDNLQLLPQLNAGFIAAMNKVEPAYCTAPAVLQGCCNYGFLNETEGKNNSYYAPTAFFSDETSARNFYLGVKPEMPFFIPYRDSKVHPYGGWYYGNGNGHGSVDYSKESDAYGAGIDPTFEVYAAAPGKVLSAVWNDFVGNFIIIEHTAPNGTKYRTGYFHLRGGFDHDVAAARKIKVNSGDPKERDSLYKKFANLPNPSTLLWGTNAQKLKVKAGDYVAAGQHIAYAGNTGYGGAGWGLKTDGTPSNPYTANNHLHFMLWLQTKDGNGAMQWLELDPYGIYAKIEDSNRDCYEPGNPNGLKRFFAAFYPSFHNVPVEYIVKHWDYYTGMGMALQTLDVHRSGNKYLASGSFQYGLPSQWYCRINMNNQQFQQYFDEYWKKGFVPGQMSVCNDNSGNPLFTTIWRRRKNNEVVYTWANMSETEWNNNWNKYVTQQKMRCAEHIKYLANGKVMHAAVFTSDNPGFYVWHGMSINDMQQKFDDLAKQNFMPINLQAEETGGATKFGGVWVPKGNKNFVAYAELSPSQYQQRFDEMNGKGFQLYRIQGYNNSNKFVAIWTK